LADSNLKRIESEVLDLGRVDLPQKRDIKVFVVTSPDLAADIQPGGRDVEGDLQNSEFSCKRAKVYILKLDFGSVLPPGRFKIRFPIFSRKPDGLPDISPTTQEISGSVSRIWMKADIVGNRKLVITNKGNIAASRFSFAAIGTSPIKIVDNRCDGIALNIGETCEITFDKVQAPAGAMQDWKADYADSNDYLDMHLSVVNNSVNLIAFNKFYAE
jgi:hypothetical protein